MSAPDPQVEGPRRLVAAASMIVTLWYLHWRVTETLNPSSPIFSWTLIGAEVFGAVTTFLFYYTVWKLREREAPPRLAGRTVDVLVPTMSEPTSVLRKTLLACNRMRYPHRTLVLDDGGRPEVARLCEELGCVYLARKSHEGAKAGNLNWGLQHSAAEFVAVFDADHVPLPDFIDRLIGYFEDADVAYVQTPQEFYNIDSFQHRVDHRRKYIWGEQYLFFSLIQPGRDHRNAAYFVGSCALLRREALDDIDGFSTASITEDLLTSIRLHARGWESVYHNENLAYGIAAETILPFHIQRRRWGIGGWQVFFRANPLFVRGLTLSQRLCYLAALIYPLEGIQKVIFYLTPPIALVTGVLPMRALDVTYLLHFVPYYALSVFAFNEMGRGYGGTLLLEQFSMGKFATYLRTMAAFLLPAKGRSFRVTPKAERGRAGGSLLVPQSVVLAVSVAAIAYALIGLLRGQRADEFVIAVNSLWALFNTGLALAILQYGKSKLVQRRGEFRMPESVPARWISDAEPTGRPRLAVADNLTPHGLSLLTRHDVPEGSRMLVELDFSRRVLSLAGRVVRTESSTPNGVTWTRAGVEFHNLSTAAEDALVRYLHDASVTKYMGEYSTRYRTYLERQATGRRYRVRAQRAVAYVPVFAVKDGTSPVLGVLRDVSEGGVLLEARVPVEAGDAIEIRPVLDDDQSVSLAGTAVWAEDRGSDEYVRYVVGVKLDESSRENVKRLLAVAGEIEELLPA